MLPRGKWDDRKGQNSFSAPRSNSAAAMNHLAAVNAVLSTTLRSTSINQLIIMSIVVHIHHKGLLFCKEKLRPEFCLSNIDDKCRLFISNWFLQASASILSTLWGIHSYLNFAESLRLISFRFNHSDRKFNEKFNKLFSQVLSQSLKSLMRLRSLFWARIRSNLHRDRYLLGKLFLKLSWRGKAECLKMKWQEDDIVKSLTVNDIFNVNPGV